MMKLPEARDLMGAVKGQRVFTYMGAFGHVLLKASHLYGNLPTLSKMARGKPEHFEATEDHDLLKYEDGKVSGGKNLPQTAEYTFKFCKALYQAWTRSFNFTLP